VCSTCYHLAVDLLGEAGPRLKRVNRPELFPAGAGGPLITAGGHSLFSPDLSDAVLAYKLKQK
jgi:hypothetical protein